MVDRVHRLPESMEEFKKMFSVTAEQMDEQAEMCRKFIDSTLKEGTEGVPPSVAVLCMAEGGGLEQTICVMQVEFNEPREKHHALQQLGAMFFKDKKLPLCWFLVSEAWTAQVSKEECFLGESRISRTDRPDRKEVVQYTGMSFIGGLSRAGHIEVERDFENKMFVGPNAQWYESKDSGENNLLRSFGIGYQKAIPKELLAKIIGEMGG